MRFRPGVGSVTNPAKCTFACFEMDVWAGGWRVVVVQAHRFMVERKHVMWCGFCETDG
jgi:hypothetical protein